jgi:protein O-mannosyl-transferase
MFMPSVGFCIIIAALLIKYLKTKAVIAALAISALFGLKTFTRNFDWKDNYTIFTTDVNVSQNSAKLQCSAGGTMIEHAAKETDPVRKKAELNEAITHLRRSLEIHPQFKNPYLLLGNAYIYLENYDQAITEYQNALKLDPQFKDVMSNISLAYRESGKIYGQQKNDLVKAIDYLLKAVQYNPQDGQAWAYLGTCYGISGQTPKAIEAFEKALSIRFDPSDANNLSTAYRMTGNLVKADEWAAKAK